MVFISTPHHSHAFLVSRSRVVQYDRFRVGHSVEVQVVIRERGHRTEEGGQRVGVDILTLDEQVEMAEEG